MKKLLLLLGILLPSIVFATQITVPSAPGYGYALVSTSTGAYIATTTSPYHVGSIYATSTTQTSIFNGNLSVSGNTTLVGLSGGGVLCLHVSNAGLIGTAAADCGSGGGSTGVGTVATSSLETAGQVPYWTTTSGYPAKLSSIATSTITFSGPFVIPATLGTLIGGSNSTITYTGLATTSQPSSSNILVSNGGAGVYGVATTSATINNGLTGTLTTINSQTQTIGLASLGSGGVLGAQTATTPTVQATSTLYGTGIGGQVLGWNNNTGGLAFIATSSLAAGVTSITGSANQITASASTGAVTLSIPSNFQFPLSYTSTYGTTTYASSTVMSVSGSAYLGTGGGNIGIGTTSPSKLLSIDGGTGPNALTVCQGAGNSCAYFGFTASGNQAATIGTLSNAGLFFMTNGLTRLAVSNSGLVGIGTTTSQWPLELVNATKPQLDFFDGGTTDLHSTIRFVGGTTYFATSTFAATSTIPALTISTNSYLGIGTSTPGSQLSINGIANFTSATSTIYNGLNITGGCFSINNICVGGGGGSGTVTSITLGGGLDGPSPITTTGTITAQVGTSSSETNGYFPKWTTTSGTPAQLGGTSALFQSGNNIGIGTTTPNWLLQVAGTRPSLALTDTGAAVNNKHWLFSSMGGNLYIGTSTDQYATSSPSVLTLLNSGVPSLTIGSTTCMTTLKNGSLCLGGNTVGGQTGSSTISGAKWQMDIMNSAGTRTCAFIVGTTFTIIAGACNP